MFKNDVSNCKEVVSYGGNQVKIWKIGQDAPIYKKEFEGPVKHLGTNGKKFAVALGNGTVAVCDYPFEDVNEQEHQNRL